MKINEEILKRVYQERYAESLDNAANELVHKFFGLTCKHKKDDAENEGLTNAKKCATIVCDEIISQYVEKSSFTPTFYEAVKREIKKI